MRLDGDSIHTSSWPITPISDMLFDMILHPDDVFIPGGLPEETYVSREHLNLESKLKRWNERRQKPLLSISGPTKSGKTVLLKKNLPNAIWFSGGAIDTADDFWTAVCDELEVFTDRTLSASQSSSSGGEASFGGGPVPAGLSGKSEDTSQRQVTLNRRADPRSAARRALKGLERVLVIDDFHYVEAAQQLQIVRGLKDLVFEGLGVVVAAVPHRAYDVVRVETEMTGRVETLSVAVWDREDLNLIAAQGFKALDVEVSDSIVSHAIDESFTSPHLMQTHCLKLCEENYVDGRLRHKFIAPEWERFFGDQASSTSKMAFDLLKAGPRTRTDRTIRTLNSGIKTDIYGAVLAAIESTGPKTVLTYDEVRGALRDVLGSGLPQRHEVTNVLGQMTRIAKERIEGEPVLEYDEELSTLHLVDPYFAYYLRWATPMLKDIVVSRPVN